MSTANYQSLLKDYRAIYGNIGGDNPGIQTLMLFDFLRKTSSGSSSSVTTSTSVASTVTIKGSTGATVLTDSAGAVIVSKGTTEDTLLAVRNRLPLLVNGRMPVSLDFPSNQTVTISNPKTDYAKDTTINVLLQRIPESINSRLPVEVTFPALQKVTVDNQLSGYATESTLATVLGRLPQLASGNIPVALEFPTNQNVTVSNQLTGFSSEATLASILSRVPTLANGKTPVLVDFPANQNVTVSNPITGFSTETTLATILTRTPALINNKTPVDVAFPTTQRVIVDNPSDVAALGKETTLAAILSRIPADISRAIAQGFRTEFTNASPLATALPPISLGGSPLWGIARTKQIQGLDAFTLNFFGRRSLAFNSNGFTDIADYDLQTAGNNLRTPVLNGTQSLEVVSSNAADSAIGTGIRTVEVMYLDENFALKNVVLTLNGTTAIALTIKSQSILKFYAVTLGSSSGAAGNIDIRIPSTGLLGANPVQIVDRISIGETASLTARACVPEGYLGYLLDVSGAAITANHDFRLAATAAQWDKRLLDGVFNTQDLFSANAGTIPVLRTLPYIELPSRCRVRLSSKASANNASASGGFTVIFVKKPV